MPSDPLRSFEGVAVNDVLQVAVKLQDKRTGDDFWWRRFVIVTEEPTRDYAYTMTLKMRPESKDHRILNIDDPKQVIQKLEEHELPQGVVAMKVLAMTRGFKTDDDIAF